MRIFVFKQSIDNATNGETKQLNQRRPDYPTDASCGPSWTTAAPGPRIASSPGHGEGRDQRRFWDGTPRSRRALGEPRPSAGRGQEWSEARRFPGRIIIDEREPALRTASEWSRPDTIWTDSSRQDSGTVRAACAWRTQGGWTGRQLHLGSNKRCSTQRPLPSARPPRL